MSLTKELLEHGSIHYTLNKTHDIYHGNHPFKALGVEKFFVNLNPIGPFVYL